MDLEPSLFTLYYFLFIFVVLKQYSFPVFTSFIYKIWSFNFLFMSLSADIFLTLSLGWGYISLVVMWPSKLWRYILETRRCKLRILIYEPMDNLWIKFLRNSIWQHFILRTKYNEWHFSKLNILGVITIRKTPLYDFDWVK